MKPGLLFLAHRIPFPPNKGDKIRSFHLLRHLSAHYAIHLGAFVDDPDDWQHADALGKYCASMKLVPLNPSLARLGSLRGLLNGQALSLPYYRSRALRQWVAQQVRQHGIQRGVAYSSAAAQFMPELAVRVLDMVDVDSDKWQQYAPDQRWPLSALYAREARRLAAWEAQVARSFDATVLVSEVEAELLRKRVPDARHKIGAYENGVDASYFSLERAYPDPFAPGVKGVVFTGAMDYWPNVEAVTWFAEYVFPAVRNAEPAAQFTIVGSHPNEAVRSLARHDSIVVTGSVPDVRPYLAHAACAVAPLRIARGIQNKVLEAMAMGCNVVSSPQAAEGIRALAGRDYRLANDAADFSLQVLECLRHGQRNPQARAHVHECYDWGRNLRAVDELFVLPNEASRIVKAAS